MTQVVVVPIIGSPSAAGCPPTQKLNQSGITIGDHTWTAITNDLVLNNTPVPSNEVMYASHITGTDEFLVGAWRGSAPRRERVCRYRLNADRSITLLHQFAIEDSTTTFGGRPSTFLHSALAGSAGGRWAHLAGSSRVAFFDGTTPVRLNINTIFAALPDADPAESFNRPRGVYFLGEMLLIAYTSYTSDADHYGYLAFDTAAGTPTSDGPTGWTRTRMGTVSYGPDSLYYISDAMVILADDQILMMMAESDSSTGTTLDTQSRPYWVTREPTADKGTVKVPVATHWDSMPGIVNYYDGQVWFASTDGYYENTDPENQGRDYVVSFRVEDDEVCAFEVTQGESVSNHFNLWRPSATSLPEVIISPYTATLAQFTHASTQSNYVDANGQPLDTNAPSFSPVVDESFPDITHYAFDNVMTRAAFFNIGRQLVFVHTEVFAGSGQVNDVPGVLVYDIDWEPGVVDTTIWVTDSFDRADTVAGTLGTTSDGLATWENEDPDPGFGFRILSNVARGSGGTNHQTIDVLGTTPGIVSGTLVRGASAAQGSLALLYGVTDGPTPGELSYIRLSRATAFADLYSIEVIYDGGNEEELVSLFNQGIAGQKVGLSRDGSTVQLFVNDMPHSTYEITTPLVPPVGQKHGIRVQAQPDCWVENWSFAPNLPSIYDTFNKADGSPLNPASDGGTWNQWSRDTSLPGSDPSVYPVNDAQIIESNRARIAHVDPVTGGYVAGWIAREIPGTSPNYEFSIDVFRNRVGGSDLGLDLHMLVSEPVGAVSQNAPGYRFSFGQYANTTRVVNTNPGGSASPYAAQAYGAWAQGVTRRLTVRREGAVITMLVDGVVIFTWTDPSPSADTRWAYIPNGDYFDRFDNFLGRELP